MENRASTSTQRIFLAKPKRNSRGKTKKRGFDHEMTGFLEEGETGASPLVAKFHPILAGEQRKELRLLASFSRQPACRMPFPPLSRGVSEGASGALAFGPPTLGAADHRMRSKLPGSCTLDDSLRLVSDASAQDYGYVCWAGWALILRRVT